MKKLSLVSILTTLTLTLSLLTSSIISTNANPSILPGSDTSYTMIAYATQSTYNPSDSCYHTILQNENGEVFTILSVEDISGQWFNCSVDSNNTPDIIQDDKIIDLGLLED